MEAKEPEIEIDLVLTDAQIAIFNRAAQKEGGTLSEILKEAVAGNR